jgi:YegS/Rv2252/BmrU family lipid kinase
VKLAVVAHSGKTFGGGLGELRRVLAAQGIAQPLWFEVPKSRKAPAQVRRAIGEGADLVFVWGGDGMVQRCADVLAGSSVTLAILPAGTANLFATNLRIPSDLEQAVVVGLRGERRSLDLARFNGERFAVMAGVGFDAVMIRDAGGGGVKDRLGRVSYIWSGSRNLRRKPFKARISIDGANWYKGKASCILVGNVGELFGGVTVFEDAHPDDGLLEVGVVTAEGLLAWSEVLARAAFGTSRKSRFAHTTKARSVKVKLKQKVLYELDGGDRTKVSAFKVKVEPAAITVCVPPDESGERARR